MMTDPHPAAPSNEHIVTCECSADPPRTAEECRQWNEVRNPGTRWAWVTCDCDCHEEEWPFDEPQPSWWELHSPEEKRRVIAARIEQGEKR